MVNENTKNCLVITISKLVVIIHTECFRKKYYYMVEETAALVTKKYSAMQTNTSRNVYTKMLPEFT